MLSGELELERLDALSDDDVIAELVAVKGLGLWTAHMFLMFHLERPDVLPVGDLGIRRAIERAYGLEGLPDAADDGADRRAVAPASHARVPLPVALAGQRADLDREEHYRFFEDFLAPFFGAFFLLPYFLRACFSHATRLLFFLSFLQALSALASSCAFVSLALNAATPLQPVIATGVVSEMNAPFWPVISVGSEIFCLHRLKFSLSGTLGVSAECGPAGKIVSNLVNGASGALSKRE